MAKTLREEEREELIRFIKTNDNTYNYNAVNFRYYTDRDLIILKKILDKKLEMRAKPYKIPTYLHFRKAEV